MPLLIAVRANPVSARELLVLLVKDANRGQETVL